MDLARIVEVDNDKIFQMNYTIPLNKKEKLFGELKEANTSFQKIYPGDRSDRQPVHTLYGGANLFKYDSAKTLGERALEILETYAPIIIKLNIKPEVVHKLRQCQSNMTTTDNMDDRFLVYRHSIVPILLVFITKSFGAFIGNLNSIGREVNSFIFILALGFYDLPDRLRPGGI